MKRPKKARTWIKETDNVIDKVLRAIGDKEKIEKKDFEKVLDLVIEQISKNRGIAPEIIGKETNQVIEAMTQFLQDIPPENRSWEVIISFLYLIYQSKLGILTDDMMAKINSSTAP